MANIITCDCGAKVRLPADSRNRVFRCPKCKTGMALTVDAKVLTSTRLQPGDPGATCPICQSSISHDDAAVSCPGCDQFHHCECWAEVGGCGTYGCDQAPALDKADATAEQPLSAWGDEKQCPACGETIRAIAVRCRYCGTEFDTVDPLKVQDLRRKVRREESNEFLKRAAVVLFVFSLLGCMAPLVAVVGMALLFPKHDEFARQEPLYVVLGYSAIGLSVIYSVLMLVFLIL